MDSILTRPDGSITVANPSDGKKFTLEEVYKLLGCNTVEVIHPVCIYGQYILLVDEEGKLNPDAKPNELATMFYGQDVLVGNIIICHRKYFSHEYKTRGLTSK